MPEKKEIVTPTGFLRILIKVEDTVPESSLSLVRSMIDILSDKPDFYETFPVRIGSAVVFALEPGVYTITARLGTLSSEQVFVEVKEGQIEELVFHFGKRDRAGT